MVDILKEGQHNNTSGQYINATLLKQLYNVNGLKINNE
jgi:hypothetical protein